MLIVNNHLFNEEENKKKSSKFVTCLSRKLIARYNAVLIFVFGFEYLLHEASVIFVNLVSNKGTFELEFVNLSVKISANL